MEQPITYTCMGRVTDEETKKCVGQVDCFDRPGHREDISQLIADVPADGQIHIVKCPCGKTEHKVRKT